MKKKANILFCTDKNYVIPMSVAITSLFENNKDLEICIYIFHSELGNKDKENILSLQKKYNQEIKLIYIEDFYFKEAPVLRWSREAYFRLLINEKIDVDMDRLIYFDCDTIINKNIKDIIDFDLHDNLLGMLEEKNAPQIELFNLKDKKYFQSGVILFDFRKTGEYLTYSSLEKIILKYKDKIITVDQDIFNILFNGKIQSLSKKINNIEITTYKNNYERLFNIVNKKDLENIIVFHYANSKPWNNIFIGSCEDIWMKYLRLSPYSYLYKEKYNSLKYKIFRLGIFKFLFFYYLYFSSYINSFFRLILNEKNFNKLKNFYRKYVK